jgi:hypothetical protein
MKAKKLIPPDLNQCQATIQGGSFMSFGPIKHYRCRNKPSVIAEENKPNTNGLRGAMSLCEVCQVKMIIVLGKNYATFKSLK